MRETPGSRIFAGSCTVVQSVRHFTTTAYASRRTTVCATKRAVNDDGVCEQAYDSVCNVSAVNDDVVATGSNDGLSAHRGVKGLCMCDTCDLSALDSAQ